MSDSSENNITKISDSEIIPLHEKEEIRNNVQNKLDSIKEDQKDLKLFSKFTDIFSVIACILYSVTILSINQNLAVQYWIPSLFIFILFLIIMNANEYLRFTINNKNKRLYFKDNKQLIIAISGAQIPSQEIQKQNETAFAIILGIGWLILIYQILYESLELNILFFVVYITLIVSTVILIIYRLIRVNLIKNFKDSYSKIFNSTMRGKLSINTMESIGISENLTIQHKIYIAIAVISSVANIIFLILLIKYYPIYQSWNYFVNVIFLFIFQVLIFILIIQFISYVDMYYRYEHYKVYLKRSLAALSKQNLLKIEYDKIVGLLLLVDLFIVKKQRFALIFSRWVMLFNGEFNVEENFEVLYKLLEIPPESQ